MGMRSVYALFLLLSALTLSAQEFPSENWYEGRVTLNNGTEIAGFINYDLDANAIQVSRNERIETYHAKQFYTFTISVKEEGFIRSFYVLPFANETGYKRPTVFELIIEGKISLLTREYIATRSINTTSGFYGGGFNSWNNPYSRWNNPYNRWNDPLNRYNNPSNNTRQRYLAFRLFIVDDEGKVTPISNNKKEVIAALGAYPKELKRFIKENKLKMDNVKDVADLINFFNNITS